MPIRVFLSSKMKEFETERAAIANQIAGLRGFQVNAAEEWGAHSASVENIYRGGVRDCHIYVGLFGRVYSAATQAEYDEACLNPYRQKLIYIRPTKKPDPELAALIEVFKQRHRPYQFRNLWELQPQLVRDLDGALDEIVNQTLERGEARPVAHGADPVSVSEEAWKNKQAFLTGLYSEDDDLTPEHVARIRQDLQKSTRNPLARIINLWRGTR
jgi:Domain of unknown function (DUF4062)